METSLLLLCKLLVLWLCAKRSYGFNITALENIAKISRDYDVRSYTTERIPPATTLQTYRYSRWQRNSDNDYARMAPEHPEYQDEEEEMLPDDHDHDHHHHHHNEDEVVDTKAMSEAKNDYWGGYYDFLINEGSYKFWAVFQLATAALLIYSGFAALYYAKVNPMYSEDYDEFFARRRKRSINGSRPLPRERPFLGFEPKSFQRILDAIAKEMY